MKVVGIRRAARFSPNSIERDAAIFGMVCDLLRGQGHVVTTYDEDNLPQGIDGDVIFSMARQPENLQRLAAVEQRGIPVINSAIGLLKWNRKALTDEFERAGIAQPRSLTTDMPLPSVDTSAFGAAISEVAAHIARTLLFPLWLKRGDACAQSAGDVQYIDIKDTEDLSRKVAAITLALHDFKSRGTTSIVAAEHLEGDLVKFYGVEGTDFFYLYYPTKEGLFSKFDLEKINGAPHDYPFDPAALKAGAERAARLTGIPVYGGDAIVDREGKCYIIDFNDWPSFSRCRNEAASAIVRYIENYLR